MIKKKTKLHKQHRITESHELYLVGFFCFVFFIYLSGSKSQSALWNAITAGMGIKGKEQKPRLNDSRSPEEILADELPSMEEPEATEKTAIRFASSSKHHRHMSSLSSVNYHWMVPVSAVMQWDTDSCVQLIILYRCDLHIVNMSLRCETKKTWVVLHCFKLSVLIIRNWGSHDFHTIGVQFYWNNFFFWY